MRQWPTFPIRRFSARACDAIQRISAVAPNLGHETGANTRIFMGFWDCTFIDDVVHISSVSLVFEFSHFDTCRLSHSC